MPANTLNTNQVSWDKLCGLRVEFWQVDFNFEVAIDGGLNHAEHNFYCGLDVDVFLYSHHRDEIVVVLGWIPLVLFIVKVSIP